MDLLKYNGFAIQKEIRGDKEGISVSMSCCLHKIPIKIIKNKEIPNGYIPIGTVEWIEDILNRKITPDYYPDFLKEHLNRKVWKQDKWPLGKKVFINPSDRYKRFTGLITTGGYHKKKRGPYWCSDVVFFENEWRYYISNGKILTGEWYCGDEINTPAAPTLNIDFPNDFCGAVDFGIVNGKITLVESNHPYSCGWYGKNNDIYTQWLVYGWEYMQEKI
jgi:hypothetical protein